MIVIRRILMSNDKWYLVKGRIFAIYIEEFTLGSTDSFIKISALTKGENDNDNNSISAIIDSTGIEYVTAPVMSVKIKLGDGASGVFRLIILEEI